MSSNTGKGTGIGSIRLAAYGEPSTVAPATKRNPEFVSTVAPVILAMPKPAYTDSARAAGIQGEVIVEVNLLASGQAVAVRVVSGLGYGLDDSALRLVEGLRFTPATLDGRPVDRVTRLHVIYQLADQ